MEGMNIVILAPDGQQLAANLEEGSELKAPNPQSLVDTSLKCNVQ